MKLPIIPVLVAVILLSTVVYLFNTNKPDHHLLDVPKISQIADVDGIETEVALSPDGNRYAVVSDGALWLLDMSNASRRKVVGTPEAASFPAWSPDGKRITFTRGADTLVLDRDHTDAPPAIFKENATSLRFSSGARTVFVRDRALWIADSLGRDEKRVVEADPRTDIAIHSPRFSPDSTQIAYIKSVLELRGEVWTLDVTSGMARPLVVDRAAENPMDVAWINGGKNLVYLTNRAGAYSLWQIDLAESTILPLTPPLESLTLGRIGMGVFQDRIVLPRHSLDSNIEISEGHAIIATPALEFEPAVSADGQRIAYTVANDNKFEIWTAGIDGSDPKFRALGREPHFSANGFQIIYTHTDLEGNEDIWQLDTRNGDAERVTDAEEIDVSPFPSPDGRSIAFASERGGSVSVWSTPVSGGKRLRLNEAGYAPRFSSNGRSIVFWNNNALWTMDAEGGPIHQSLSPVSFPGIAVWTSQGPAVVDHNVIRSGTGVLFSSERPLLPAFDLLPDGHFLIAPVTIREAGLWAVDMTYKSN